MQPVRPDGGPRMPAPNARLLEAELKRDGVPQVLSAGSELPQNQELALRVQLEGSGHAYLVRTPAQGAAEVLFPRLEAPDLAQPVGPLRVPAAGEWLKLVGFVPSDALCLIFSSEPLPRSEVRCTDDSADEKNPYDIPPPPPPPPTVSGPKPPPPPPRDKKVPGSRRPTFGQIRLRVSLSA